MARESKTWLVLSLFVVMVASCMQHSVLGDTQVPGVFIFGDSLYDSGNNNNLPTKSKANFLPYGIDFPTGRFTNGRNSVDKLTQLLGFEKFIPPFANLSGLDILKGVNYASGSSGIRNETGTNLGTNVNLGLQLQNHRSIVSQIATREYPGELCSSSYSPAISDLHNLGARKYVLVGLDRLGCIPKVLINGSCVEDQNSAAFLFNDNLKSLVNHFNNKTLTDSKFIFINTTAIVLNKSLGFTDFVDVCCPTNESGFCIPNGIPCQNRSEYVFWDGIHTTEAANIVTAIVS